VQVYNAEGKPETTISMAEASYDLTLGELASKTPSRIEQPRFTMTGDKLTYQSESRIATMNGKVRLVVPDVGGLATGLGFPGSGK
jgi:lipopolysaccharide export system protein LptC